MVWKIRSVPAGAGIAGRDRFSMRRRFADARERRRHGRRPAAFQKRPRTYSDYRKMLAEKDLDLVLIAPPDHWHALIMIEAAKSGVDIWVQKPISRDVLEGKAMLAAARRTIALSRLVCNAAARLTWSRQRALHRRGQAREDRAGRDLLLLPHARDGKSPG